MRIVTWNMGCASERSRYRTSHGSAWEFLLAGLKPDVALLQEAVPLGGSLERYQEPLWTPAFAGGDVGSMIIVASEAGKLTLTDADLDWSDHRVQVAHGALEGIGGVCVVNVHARTNGPMFPRLRQTMEWVIDHRGQRFIVGGDFNSGRSHPASWAAHTTFWDDIDGDWAFKEPLPFGRGERQSYWAHWAKNVGPTLGNSMQDDHILVDAETFEVATECRVWDTKQVRELSDHGPVVVDLDIPQPTADGSSGSH